MGLYAWGVPNAEEKRMLNATKVDATTRANRRLPKGTLVVSHEDGESGRIVNVSSFRRNGVDAWSYVVETQYGNEVWEVDGLFVPDARTQD